MSHMRPSDLALFLLASGESLPRQRARDQQADIAGLELKRKVLDMLVASDPEPADLDAALMRIVDELGPPSGPTRAICMTIREEWQAAALVPGFAEWLLDQALRESANPGERRGRRGREPRTEDRGPRTEDREPGAENREPRTENRPRDRR